MKRRRNRAFFRPAPLVVADVDEDDAPKKTTRTMSLEDDVPMSAVLQHVLTQDTADPTRGYRALALDPQSVLMRQRGLLARFRTPEAREAERARLQRAIVNFRAGRLRPSQLCPGVADDCPDYVRLQIHVECEDQLRALDMVLIEPAATAQAMVVAVDDEDMLMMD